LNRLLYLLKDDIKVFKNILIPKTYNTKTFCFKILGAFTIF